MITHSDYSGTQRQGVAVSDGGAADRGVLLLVEDDPDHAFFVRRQLAEHGVGLTLVHLSTALDAVARLADPDVRCVVLDLSLPDAEGMQALHAVRAADARVPIVVLTGLASDAVGLQALQSGAQDYLVKGQHTADAVARAVRFAIERARREAAERSQAESEAQLSQAQRLARIGSWDWDVRTGEVLWSDELRRLTGLADARGQSAFARYLELVAEQDRPQAARLFSVTAAEDPPVVVRHRLVRPDGGVRWVQGHMTPAGWDADGRPTRVLGTVQDITEQKTAEDALAHQALHDGLTGLVNRGVLLDRLTRVLSTGHGDGLVAVVFLDLDQFKWVNDSRSHSAGDRLLVDVSRALQEAVRPTDTLARFGGDEFVVLCEDVADETAVVGVVERLAAALDRPFTLEAGTPPVTVTASMGVATARSGSGTPAEGLVRDADIAMYRAKERGRARFELFDERMRLRAAARLQVESDLRAALQRGEIEVHFQPVVDPRTGRLAGTEALARWQHPTGGLLLPEQFVPHAEQSGLIVPLGVTVLRAACVATVAWNRGREVPLTVSVNLSARQLSHPQLLDVVAEALDGTGLPASLLCLEVTETAVMEDAEASARVLARLRDLGVRVVIDDFGTGYCSLAYLLSLPVDGLKVDRSFVAAVGAGGAGTAIVGAVVALAQTLGLSVVAEGVETTHQRGLLLGLGVGLAQGLLWGGPVAAQEAAWAVGSDPLVEVPGLAVPAPRDRPGPVIELPGGPLSGPPPGERVGRPGGGHGA